jgi:hypothetical protein
VAALERGSLEEWSGGLTRSHGAELQDRVPFALS